MIDMQELNQFAEYLPFKMEDISQLKDILRRGDYMTKLDLQDAYLTIPVGPKSKIFVRFLWKGALYQFTNLPFGLSPSARLFTKTLKPVIAFLRSMGIRLLIFLEDMMADSLERAAEHTELVIRVLESLGFVIKKKKSILKPTQTIPFLGFIVNSIKMLLLLPEGKLQKLKSSALSLLENVPTAREILSFLGQCQAALPALQVAPLYFKAIQRDLISPQGDKVNYKKTISLSEGAIKDLLWWTQSPAQANGRVIIPPKVDSVIFSDTTKIGWGAHLLEISIGGRWKELEALDHINYLELEAAFLTLRAFLALINGSHVQFGLDNHTAVAYINRLGGIGSQHLTALALDIWCYALDRNMIISAIHVPGKWNRIADGKSRIFHDSIEWMLDHNLFKQVTKHLGLPVVDLFASRVNHQIPEFVSWRPEPGTIATNAFNIPWDFPLSYLFPPFCLTPMCLRKVIQEQVDCILIAPVWRSRPLYPALLSMLIERPSLLPQGQRFLKLPGTDKIHPLCCQKKFQLAAWKISGKTCKRKAFRRKCQKFYYPRGEAAQPSNMKVLGFQGWSSWCSKEKVNPFSATIKHILSYLADLFHQGRQYRMIGVHCSAISSFHIPLEGVVVGQHPLVTKFMKGIFSLRPPKPWYFVTWDVNDGLQLLRSWSPAKSLSLKKLSLNLATSRPTKSGSKNPLFLSYIKPHGPVTSTTLARWVKSALAQAGIDTTKFKAHSSRSASSLAAYEAGVALPDIMEAADWFHSFYLH